MIYPISPAGLIGAYSRLVFPTLFTATSFATKPRFGQVQTGFLPSEQSGCKSGMEAAMTLTPELKEAGAEPALIENPGTYTACPVVPSIPWRLSRRTPDCPGAFGFILLKFTGL